MQSYKALSSYFTTGTAETESTIIDAAYVSPEGVLEIINPPHSSPRILVGKKGSGKSIVMRYCRNRFQEAGVPVLLLRPSDLNASRLPTDRSLGALIRYYKDEIVTAIAAHLGRHLKGFISEEHEAVLSKVALEAKSRTGDWFEKALATILPLGAGIAKVDYSKLAASLGEVSRETIEKAILANLGTQKHFFYFLFDDTDQITDSDEPNHLNRIWAFILALRQIMERCPNIRCIVTLRAEVWIRLCRDRTNHRDQVDHIRPLVIELNPTESDVADIATRRFELARIDANFHTTNELTSLYFEGDVVLPDFDQARNWYDFLVKRSRERPRDLVQLVAKLIECANRDRSKPDKINEHHAAAVVTEFSKTRVDDLSGEVHQECAGIEPIIRTFAAAEYDIAGYSMTASSLLNHIRRIPSRCPVNLFGRHLRQMNDEDAFLLWKYLFDIGFLGARYADSDMPKGFTHKSARDDSTLITQGRRQELDLIHWDINPAYRDFLQSIRKVEYLSLPNPGAKKRPRP